MRQIGAFVYRDEWPTLSEAKGAKSLWAHRGRLAQLVRVLPSHGRGHWFEPSIAHHEPLTEKEW